MNKVILIGNLTRDPEMITTSQGIPLCKFGIAVNSTYGGDREADFFNIVAWRQLGENCGKFLTKGSKVAVAGRIQTRTYDDREGIKRHAFEIVADDVQFLSTRNSSYNEDGGAPTAPRQQNSSPRRTVDELTPVPDDGLPF